MVSLETDRMDFEPGEMNDDESVDMSTTKNIMGSQVGFAGIWKCYHSQW